MPASLQQVGGFQTDLSNDVSRVDRLSRVNAQVDATYSAAWPGQHTLKAGVQFDRRGNDVDKGRAPIASTCSGTRGARRSARPLRLLSRVQQPHRSRSAVRSRSATSATRPSACSCRTRGPCTPGSPSTWGCGRRTRPCRSTVRWGRRGPPSRSIFRSATSWRHEPERRGTSPATADGRCTAAGECSTTSSSCPCRRRRSAAFGSRFTPSISRRPTGRTCSSSPDCPPACPGGQARPPVQFDPSFENIDPDLDPMRMQELTVGVEHQLSPHVAVSARFVHKQLDKAVEDIGRIDADGNATYVIGNPGYFRATEAIAGVPYPKAVRDYDAVEIVGRKLLDRNWALTASYVWSRLHGNYSGLSESDENGRTEPNIGLTFDARARAVRRRRPAAVRAPGHRPPSPGQGAVRLHGAVWRQRRRVPVGRQRASGEPLRGAVAGHRAGVLCGPGQRGPHPGAVADRHQRAVRAGPGRTQAADARAERAEPVQPGPGRVAVQPRKRPGRPGRDRSRPTTMPDGPMSARHSTSNSCRAIHGSCNTSSSRSPSRHGWGFGSVFRSG